MEVPFRAAMADSPPSSLSISTNPKPFDWPVKRSIIIWASVTVPYGLNIPLN
jgi:hypothetical protein